MGNSSSEPLLPGLGAQSERFIRGIKQWRLQLPTKERMFRGEVELKERKLTNHNRLGSDEMQGSISC
jgi:hypothetical protein